MSGRRIARPLPRRDEGGSAIVEFVWLGLLLLLPVIYILVCVFQVQRASYGVSAASRSAGRAFVLAPDQASAYERARRAVAVALADQGVERSQAHVRISCRPEPDRCLVPGSVVTVVVRASQPLPLAPAVLDEARPSISVDSTHREPYGTFREERS